jgi:purine-binding chemotaxis protein CheW
MKKKNDNNLLNPEQAVESYLDSLLQEVSTPTSMLKPLSVRDNIVLLTDLEIPEPAIEPQQELQHQREQANQEIEQQQESPGKERRYDFDYPVQCLMFDVAGTRLSIPLIEMGSVLPWVEKMTKLPSAEKWSLGVLLHRGRNIRVVDTAGLLNIRKSADPVAPKHILVFGDGDWALSCDRLGEVVKLDANDIQWNGPRNNGLSMGTIKESLAQLLDPKKIMQYLQGMTEAV